MSNLTAPKKQTKLEPRSENPCLLRKQSKMISRGGMGKREGYFDGKGDEERVAVYLCVVTSPRRIIHKRREFWPPRRNLRGRQEDEIRNSKY